MRKTGTEMSMSRLERVDRYNVLFRSGPVGHRLEVKLLRKEEEKLILWNRTILDLDLRLVKCFVILCKIDCLTLWVRDKDNWGKK